MHLNRSLFVLSMILLLSSCQKKIESQAQNRTEIVGKKQTDSLIQQLKDYDAIADRKVLVIGTFHFNKKMLSAQKQQEIDALLNQLENYQPTKIVLEWEPKRLQETNQLYTSYLNNSFQINDKHNEVYQLGFKLGKRLKHDSIYLFDNQTEFIGSLSEFSTAEDPFSFKLFDEYAKTEDHGFYNKYEAELISNFQHNQDLIKNLNLTEKIRVLNSPEWQEINAQRMHLYESRVGIQKNWAGPDWLGRWYRRNLRMVANVLKLSKKGDRLLIIVGDNHKWILDMLFENTPDFEVVSKWNF